MRAVAFFCVLATAQGWKMPLASSLVEVKGRPKCEIKEGFKRIPQYQDQLKNNTKWKSSARQATEEELKDPNFLAEPYLHTVYFINLERSVARKEFMEKQLNRTAAEYHVERWAAKNRSDVKFTKASDYSDNHDKKAGHNMNGPTLATYVSHRLLLEKIAQHKDKNAVFIVLEDDVVLADDWEKEVMCQIKQLPADWDLYKFGYWPFPQARFAWDYSCSGNIRQARYNDYSCGQRSYAMEWMGNLGYAVRPQGAATAVAHLKQVPIMDVDGAMMNGCCVSGSVNVPQNVYVSRWPLIRHGTNKFNSDRWAHVASLKLEDQQKAGVTADLSTLSDEDRESSYAARVRLIEAARRGEKVSFEPADEEPKTQEKTTALAGLGA